VCIHVCVSVYYVQENVYMCETVCTFMCVECVPDAKGKVHNIKRLKLS